MATTSTQHDVTEIDRASVIDYGDLTAPQADEAQAAGALLILPVGALEQHGDSLPLSTDNLRADHVAREVAGTLHGRAYVLPTVGYGVSPHHDSYTGTVSLPPTLFITLTSSIIRSLADKGWNRILVITGHGGNSAALGVVQQDLLGTHPDLHLAWTPITGVVKRAHERLETTEVTGHSGESETAQLLAIREDLVRRSTLSPGATSLDELDEKARLSRSKSPSLAVRFERYAAQGVLGDPRTATRADGEKILAEAVEAISTYARKLLQL